MTIEIERYDAMREPSSAVLSYKLPDGDMTLLQALEYIKTKIDPTLSFDKGCRSGICGSCAMRVNDREVLACNYKPVDGDKVSPLRYHEVQRDLIVDKSAARQTLRKSRSWLHGYNGAAVAIAQEKITEVQSDCILCDSCYSACPVLAVNPDFLGPFALTRVYRYSADVREGDAKPMIDAVQQSGVWDCTLCGECTAVCPQGIDPKMDITMLRSTSAQHGYMDPNFSAMSFGFGGF